MLKINDLLIIYIYSQIIQLSIFGSVKIENFCGAWMWDSMKEFCIRTMPFRIWPKKYQDAHEEMVEVEEFSKGYLPWEL